MNQINKHVPLYDTCDTGYMYMDLSFLVYFPLSNFKTLSYLGIRYVFLLQYKYKSSKVH